jgi:hypothetical protein
MELIEDYCHWCEERVTRTASLAIWLDEEGTSICLFHPANFDARNMKATGETAYHQTIEQVHDIVIADHYRNKAMRNREPLHAVEDNVVVPLGKSAQRTSIKAQQNALIRAGSLRKQVYDFYIARDEQGATDEEAQIALGIDGNTMRPTRVSLVRDGYIIDSGRLRKNAKGHDCIVWVNKLTTGVLF